MEKDKIIQILKELLPKNEEGNIEKKITVEGTYHVGQLSGNRLNSGTLKSQIIVCSQDVWNKSDAKNQIHSDQRVFVQTGDDIWDIYKGGALDTESKSPQQLYEGVKDLKKLIEEELSKLKSQKSSSPAGSILKEIPLQQIFYGAPGTGKSHEAKKQTGELLDSGKERDLPNVFRTTFHPDTDYASFVGCYKPVSQNASRQILLDYDSLVDRFKKYIADLGNITHASAAIGYNFHDSIVKMQEDGVHTIAHLLADAHKSGTTYDTTIRSGMLLYEEQVRMGNSQIQIAYEFVPQTFTDAYIYAYNNPTEPTYLVIEEINRGNCAQIFGDLFQLLDRKNGVSEYSIKADKDLAKFLSEAKDETGKDILSNKEGIKEGKLRLPTNLHILATMNTSDQSLFPMDSAFKRRWEWEYVPINYDTSIKSGKFEITLGKETNERKYSWVGFIEKVNEKIFDLTQSEDKQMGNFFIKQSIDEKGFKSKVMFYLWYEVLRDETENNKYFFYKKTSVEGKDVLSKFTFKDLFGYKATETLQQFMAYLEVDPK